VESRDAPLLVERRAGEAGHGEIVRAGAVARVRPRGAFGDADDPAAPPAVGEEGAHGRREVGEGMLAALLVPRERGVRAVDGAEVRDRLDRDRHVERPGRREADEAGHVHARQPLRERRRQGLEPEAGKASCGAR
jgi:hypothetical protein